MKNYLKQRYEGEFPCYCCGMTINKKSGGTGGKGPRGKYGIKVSQGALGEQVDTKKECIVHVKTSQGPLTVHIRKGY